MDYTRDSDGIAKLGGRINSFPYTNWKGEVPIHTIWVILSTHKEKIQVCANFFDFGQLFFWLF